MSPIDEAGDPAERDDVLDTREHDRAELAARRLEDDPRRRPPRPAAGYRPPHGGRPTPRADA